MLSVLPAHISMGMKLAIIERLKERGDRRYMPDNNFHSLYVKRHQNVRWAAGQPCVVGSPGGLGEAKPCLSLPVCFSRGWDQIRLVSGGSSSPLKL